MLQYLHVKNLALIDEIEVEFGRGLNILTGETGAGKSIILGSVNLALGGRYTKDILRQGARYGLVELTFSVENERQIRKLKELDIYPEDGFITLQRRLMEGRSVSKINGETVQMATLKAVSSILIDIHGQHEHQSLLYEEKQLEILEDHAEEGLILPVVVFSDIHAVQGDVAFRRVIQAAQELDEGGLSCAVQAHHCHFVLQGQFAGQILQHWLCAPGVCKAHVVEFNLVHMILPLFRGNGAGVGAFQGQEV